MTIPYHIKIALAILAACTGVAAGILVLRAHDKPTEIPRYEPPTKIAKEGCRIDGCSGAICSDSSSEQFHTTCEYRERYGCYRNAVCERQTNGKCGWTETKELKKCLKDNP